MTIQAEGTQGAAGGAPAAGTQQGGAEGGEQRGFRGSSDGASLARPVETPTDERPRRPIQTAALGDAGLRARMQRAAEAERKRVLAELQIENPDAFKKARADELAELQRLKKAEEETKRAQMSEVERYRADLEAVKAETAKKDQRIAELEQAIYAGEGDTRARSAAVPYIDPDLVDYALVELKRHLRSKTDAEIEAFDDSDMRRFFRRLAVDKPKLAISKPEPGATNPPRSVAAAAPRRPAPARAPAVVKRQVAPASAIRRPAGGVPARPAPAPARPETKSGEANGKTVRPGQANSMSKAELRAYLEQSGRKPW